MVSSIAGRSAVLPLNAWYHASKFGLEALSDILRMEVAQFGVKVVVIEPGFFKTEIERKAKAVASERESVADSPYRSAYHRMQVTAGLITSVAPAPDQVARAIVSAVESRRPRSRYVVGLDALAIAVATPLLPRAVTDQLLRAVADLRG